MKDNIILAIIIIVGILSGMALYLGQNDMAIAGIGGLIGFLGKEAVSA
jgi:hypothetical protein